METKISDGFYTALGTPLDSHGNLLKQSFINHIKDQIEYNASGLLVMGSMGNEACIKQSEYPVVAKTAVEAANSKCPIFVGAMDNSVARVCDRLASLAGLKIDGVVKIQFYYLTTQEELKEQEKADILFI